MRWGEKEKERAPQWCAPLIAGRGSGSWWPGGGNRRWQNAGSGEAMGPGKAAAAVRRPARAAGCLCSDRATDMRTPRGFTFFQFIQNWLKIVKSKWMPYFAPTFPNFCMTLDWNILNNFLNYDDFKFPIEFKIKFLEQIQYLNFL
jgi:hypothetical protein